MNNVSRHLRGGMKSGWLDKMRTICWVACNAFGWQTLEVFWQRTAASAAGQAEYAANALTQWSGNCVYTQNNSYLIVTGSAAFWWA